MTRERIGKEMVPKDLEREERTFYERAVAREEAIIPDEFTGERGRPRQDADDEKEKSAQPMSAQSLGEPGRKVPYAERAAERGESDHLGTDTGVPGG
jgi:hypothetical protein